MSSTNVNTPRWEIGTLPDTRLTWGRVRNGVRHQCPTCGILLLTGEKPGFCCGPNGSRFHDVKPLPPLPAEFKTFLNDPKISKLSRRLNLILSFAALETTHPFPTQTRGPEGFISISGRVYHRVRPSHTNSAVRWLLYDGFEDVSAPHQASAWFNDVPPAWITAFRNALIRVNSFASSLRSLGQLHHNGTNASLVLEDSGTAEIAAIMSYSNTTQTEIKARRLIVVDVDGRNQSVSTLSRFWEPLAYPLLFPHGTLGWGITNHTPSADAAPDQTPDVDLPTTQMWHYRARLLREARLQVFGRLANEYIVDMFSRDLESRLAYIRGNQQRLRQNDASLMGTVDVEASENIYLPSSFLGSWRWASEQISDSLAIAAAFGGPTFFVTMTCNPEWPEITEQLRPGQTYTDIPIVVVRVFKRKLALLLLALKTMFPHVGRPVYCIYCIEFQKRGLPHAHILIKYPKSCIDPDDIDAIISAEIPDDPEDARLIRKYMLHSHPAATAEPSKYCQRVSLDGIRTCRFHYPRRLQPTTTIDTEGRVHYRRRRPGDEMVVPHCLPLIRELRCHINFEASDSSYMFGYLYKYIHKPGCSTRYRISDDADGPVDEIKDYWDARYLSAGEAAWRILGFHVAHKEPAVTALSIHLPDSTQHHQYTRRAGSSVLSTLNRYFLRPTGTFILDDALRQFEDLTYAEYFSIFRLATHNPDKDGTDGYFLEQENDSGSPRRHVILRSSIHVHLSRIQAIRPSQGELFYLRSILQIRACRSFIAARTVAGTIHDSYQDAANALGLFDDQNESIYAIMEAVQAMRTPRELRVLFVHLLTNDCVDSPALLWERFREEFSRDFTLRNGNSLELGLNFALDDLTNLLDEYGKSLTDYGLPEATIHTAEVIHELQRWSPIAQELEERANNMIALFKREQREVYEQIFSAVTTRQPLRVFVDGKGGRGKTAMITALCDKLRSLGQIVIASATSAFAAQLYPGGRTTHSAFKVPVTEKNQLLKSTIKPDSSRAELIRRAALIIWDEAPMANRAVLACIDLLLRDIMDNSTPFGGKAIVLLGDFRQTCPVIPRGSRAQVVDASIRSSPLWESFVVLRLTEPIRNAEDLPFADFVDSIGDGAGPDVALDMLEKVDDVDNLLQFVYPPDVITDPIACLGRAVLAPTNHQVDAYNSAVLALIEGSWSTYLSADTFREGEDLGIIPPASILDYVARNPPPGMPPHSLTVKTNAVFRLLRNFSIDRGLVKNARVVVLHVGQRLITVKLLRVLSSGLGQEADEELLIPRISFDAALPSGHTLLRKQFPLAPAYATTFNSCQGLTLNRLGVDLTRPVFSHGQLYTALSRIRHRSHARVRLRPGETTTQNVTYPEILV